MNGQGEVLAGAVVEPPQAPGAAQQDEKPVVLIDELADILETSVRTLKRQIRAGTLFIPELPKIDRRHRWSRAVVHRCIAEGHTLIHDRQGKTGLRVLPRKSLGEAAREGGRR